MRTASVNRLAILIGVLSAGPLSAAQQIFPPCTTNPGTGFQGRMPLIPLVDVSGTYARGAEHSHFPMFCEKLPVPPTVLELELISSQEVPDAGFGLPALELVYEGSFTTYASHVRRNACPPTDECSEPGPGRCHLQGFRYNIAATMRYVVDGVDLSYCFEPVVTFDSLVPGSDPDFLTPQSPSLMVVPNKPFSPCALPFWGDRCAEGEINYLGIGEGPMPLVEGPGASCYENLCAVSAPEVAFLPSAASTTFRLFYPVNATPERLGIEDSLQAKLVSNVPTDTDTGFDNVVESATVGVYLQRGMIPEQGLAESNADYEQRVLGQLEGERATVTLRREQDGTFAGGAPGVFETPPLSVFRLTDVAGKNIWTPAFYTLVVRNAQTEEIERDPNTNEPTGGTTTLLFGDTFITNLAPATPAFDIELDALTGLAAKKRIVDSVVAACPLNYGPAESAVSTYLQSLMAGTIELTAERDEGLRRAVWSEIAVRDSARYAGDLLPLAMDSLANFLSDLFDDIADFQRADIARGKARAEKLDETAGGLPPGYATGFKLDAQDLPSGRYADALARSELLGRRAMLASQISKTLKTIRVVIVDGLELFGVDAEEASQIATFVEVGLKAVLAGVQDGTVAGASKPVIKQLITEAVKSLSDDMVDGNLAFSYCALTSDLLVDSGQTLQTWNVVDQPAYTSDRSATAAVMAETGNASSELLWDVLKIQWTGELADLTKDVFGFIGKGLKAAAVVEKVANALKYGTNVAGFVVPVVYVFGELRTATDVASHLAYGLPPSGAATSAVGAASPATVARGFMTTAPPAPAPGATLLNSFDDLRAALLVDDFGAVDTELWGGAPGSVRVELERWVGDLRGFETAALGLDEATAAPGLLLLLTSVSNAVSDFETIAQEMLEGSNDLLVEVWTGAFFGPADPVYLARRNALVKKVEAVDTRVVQIASVLSHFSSQATAQSVGFNPALAVQTIGVESTTTQSDLVSTSPETLEVSAKIRNPSAGAVTGATARLTVVSPKATTVIAGSADIALGTLQANNGAPAGSDETEVQWQIQYTGDLTDELIYLVVEILEGGGEPVSFVASNGDRFTAVDPELGNADFDLLPDDWETAHGLDLNLDDSHGDLDADGLSNVLELDYGTLPETPDTDADGRADGDEVGGGVSSVATDPLDPDTDDDGILDGAGADPLGASGGVAPSIAAAAVTPGESVVALDATSVVLTAAKPYALVHVTNTGGGALEWAVDVEVETEGADGVVVTSPPEGVTSAGDTLLVSILPGYDLNAPGGIFDDGGVAVTLRVVDVSGAVPDQVEIPVTAGDACGGPGFDADDNGAVAPETDGLLLMRHLFGFTGLALTTGAIGEGAERTDPAAIAAHAQCIRESHLDADGNGAETPLTDGMLLLRYLFGVRGPGLIAGAIGGGCTRCDAESVEEYFADRLE